MLTLYTYLQVGGVVVWILLGFSVLATSVFIAKLWQFWVFFNMTHKRSDEALSLIEQGHQKEALLFVKNQRTPRAKTISHALGVAIDNNLGFVQFQQESIRFAKSIIAHLSSHLRVLEVIATLAPLLGLFGTVLGMISAFKAMEAAGSQVDPSVLSGGIWQALLTTAVGLAVAIPVSLAHSWLERRVESEAALIEDDLTRVFTQIAKTQHSIQSNSDSKRMSA